MTSPEANAGTDLSAESAAALACEHCGDPVPVGRERFCCSGCETVSALLKRAGLTNYYDVADAIGAERRAPPVTSGSYEAWGSEEFAALHTQDASGGLKVVDLYLEGVHCAACVWLVEALPRLVPGVHEARLDLGRSLARVRWNPQATSLRDVALTLAALGYPPHPARGADPQDRARAEDRALLVRVAVAGALAGNVMLLSFALYSGAFAGMDPLYSQLFRWLALALTLPAVLGPGNVFLRGAWASLRARTPHMDLPVGLALLIGVGWGAWNTVRGAGEIYFDTVSVLVFLLLIGRFLQQRQKRRASEAAELLQSIAPCSARRVEGEATREVPIELLGVGDVVEVRAGEAIPCDGTVLRGETRIDASLLTGESRPLRAGSGDVVLAGTLNVTATVRISALRTGEETRIGKLLTQVEECQRRAAPVVRWADRIAGVFVGVVLALAVLTLLLWLWLDPSLAVDHAVALLIVTCPCALGLATPLAVAAALGRAAREGVLVKGGEVLQRLTTPGRIWLDKTGTLSEGRTALVGWEGPDQAAQEEARGWVLALEAESVHPVAQGLRDAFVDVAPTPLDGPPEDVGGGVRGSLSGERVLVGSPSCMTRHGIALPDWADAAIDAQLARGATPALAARGERVVAALGFGDPLREDARAVVDALRRDGWRVGILSGDHPRVVRAVGEALGLDPSDCRGALLPEDKRRLVEAREGDGSVVMVGDGVNDAVALAAADVGVGVRGGSEAALATADAFLARNGLAGLPGLLGLSRSTLGVIRINLSISLAYNLLAAGLAMAGLIGPLLAAILMPISSLGVVANSYRGRASRAGP